MAGGYNRQIVRYTQREECGRKGYRGRKSNEKSKNKKNNNSRAAMNSARDKDIVLTSFGVDLAESVVAQLVHQAVEHRGAALGVNSAAKEKNDLKYMLGYLIINLKHN